MTSAPSEAAKMRGATSGYNDQWIDVAPAADGEDLDAHVGRAERIRCYPEVRPT
jgi:hypothetical protein